MRKVLKISQEDIDGANMHQYNSYLQKALMTSVQQMNALNKHSERPEERGGRKDWNNFLWMCDVRVAVIKI